MELSLLGKKEDPHLTVLMPETRSCYISHNCKHMRICLTNSPVSRSVLVFVELSNSHLRHKLNRYDSRVVSLV